MEGGICVGVCVCPYQRHNSVASNHYLEHYSDHAQKEMSKCHMTFKNQKDWAITKKMGVELGPRLDIHHFPMSFCASGVLNLMTAGISQF